MSVSGKIKIGIAEDNLEFCQVLRDYLESYPDLTVTAVANDGLEALEIIRTSLLDLLILDMIMPKLDGIAVLERVKKMNNKGILYISFNGTLHELDYFAGSSIEIIRFKYYIPDYSLDDAYNRGYIDGYIDGKAVADERAYEQGYIEGWNEGFEDGYNSGYNRAYDEISTNDDYTLGYNDGFRAGEQSKIAQNNEAFYKSIEKWLVPAIISVIVLGGIVSIIAIKRRE